MENDGSSNDRDDAALLQSLGPGITISRDHNSRSIKVFTREKNNRHDRQVSPPNLNIAGNLKSVEGNRRAGNWQFLS